MDGKTRCLHPFSYSSRCAAELRQGLSQSNCIRIVDPFRPPTDMAKLREIKPPARFKQVPENQCGHETAAMTPWCSLKPLCASLEI